MGRFDTFSATAAVEIITRRLEAFAWMPRTAVNGDQDVHAPHAAKQKVQRANQAQEFRSRDWTDECIACWFFPSSTNKHGLLLNQGSFIYLQRISSVVCINILVLMSVLSTLSYPVRHHCEATQLIRKLH
jgi:hypothetical protein